MIQSYLFICSSFNELYICGCFVCVGSHAGQSRLIWFVCAHVGDLGIVRGSVDLGFGGYNYLFYVVLMLWFELVSDTVMFRILKCTKIDGIVNSFIAQVVVRRMSTPARKRLMRDFKRLQQDPPAGISGAPYDNNIMLWNAVIFGFGYSTSLFFQKRNK